MNWRKLSIYNERKNKVIDTFKKIAYNQNKIKEQICKVSKIFGGLNTVY